MILQRRPSIGRSGNRGQASIPDCVDQSVFLTNFFEFAGDSEHQIFARVDYHCRMDNASFLAYPPVVAAGSNANIIHYVNNSQIANDGDLVLMDAGQFTYRHDVMIVLGQIHGAVDSVSRI